jgi:hypothetical protein
MNDDITKEIERENIVKTISEIVTGFSLKVIYSFWLILSLNTFFKTNFPYDFIHILSAWFFMTLIFAFLNNKK